MATTTPDAVLRALESRVEAIFTADMATARIYLSPAFFFDGIGSPYVQIVPGQGVTQHPDDVLDGVMVIEDVQIGIFERLALDQGDQASLKLADTTKGLILRRTKLWGTGLGGTTDGLVGHQLGLLLAPMTLRNWSPAEISTTDTAWAFLASTFRLVYEIAN